MEGGSVQWGREKKKEKKHVFKLEPLLNWWAPGRELFCGEMICIMGKWLELQPRALLLWGQSVKWKGKAPIRQETNTKVLEEGDVCFRYARSLCATCPFHLQNNLPTISQTYTLFSILPSETLQQIRPDFIPLTNLAQYFPGKNINK